MSKDQLEEIKEMNDIINDYYFNHSGRLAKLALDLFFQRNYIDWLIKKAERAETLEMKYENSGSMFNRQNMQARIDELEHQNQKYREADEGEFLDNLIGRLYEYENQIIRYRKVLEFYADEDNYKEFYDLMRGRNVVMVLEDDGIKAHEALDSESHD